MSKMLSVKEFADLTGHCKQTIFNLIRAGEIPAYRPGKRKLLIKYEDYLQFIEGRRVR